MDGNTDTAAHHLADRIARAAWFAAFVVPLIAAALLLGLKSAQASTPVAGLAPLSFEEELEGEEDEAGFELEACEIAEEEFEEGELGEAAVMATCDEPKDDAGQGKSAVAPEECILRSAHGHAVIEGPDTKLKLTIGYTTYEPVGATIEIGQGPSHIATLHQHLGRSGILRVVKGLHGDNAPKRLAVNIQLPSARSAGCPFRRLVLSPR